MASLSTADYFPLPDGATWDYRDNFSNTYSNLYSGTVTKRLVQINGDSQYFTNDANGNRMHATRTAFGSTTTSFKPPIPMANTYASIGVRLTSSGLADLAIIGAGAFQLNDS